LTASPPTDGETARLFLAVWPPPQIVERLAALPRPNEPGVRWVPPVNWHVTLRFLGSARPRDVHAALDGVVLPAATLVIGPRVGRLGGDGIVVPVAGASDLAAAVGDATRHVGRRPEGRGFRGHITLARLRRRGGECSVLGQPVDGEFGAAEVVLARSTLSASGASYDLVARWPTG
jgi:RNA 2',3'-cyclic 3'-phosphodiesterase